MLHKILSILPGDHPWQNNIIFKESLASTNDLAKQFAQQDAPEGTVILAGQQSAGRGRMGRSFFAPAGLGLYFSLIIRPCCQPKDLMHLTCAAAVAACDAIQAAAGIRPQIKWTNDLVIDSNKLGGILTEMSVNSKTGLVDWVVIGIGINCLHQPADFPEELQDMTTSLLQAGKPASPGAVAAHLICALHDICANLLPGKEDILARYKVDCMTLHRDVVLLRGDEKQYGKALDIDENGGLIVRFQDGQIRSVQSGEISVRGLYGYA